VALDDGVKRPNLDYHSRSKQSVSRRSRCESFAQFWTPERDVGGTDGVFRGILTISLDADLQDIAAIKTMVEFFYEGNDICSMYEPTAVQTRLSSGFQHHGCL
jgi:hypothetical protein